MEKYIEVQNKNKIIQLNDSYKNIAFREISHPTFLRDYYEDGHITITTIKPPSHLSFWFLYNNSDKEIQVGMGKAGSNAGGNAGVYNKFLFFRNKNEKVTKEFIENYIELYWFTADLPIKQSNYGLEIYNKDRKLIYSSAQKYLRIADVIRFSEKWTENTSTEEKESMTYWSGHSNAKYGINIGSIPNYVYRDEDRVSFYCFLAVIGPKNSYIKGKMQLWNTAWVTPKEGYDEYNSYKYSSWTMADITGY